MSENQENDKEDLKKEIEEEAEKVKREIEKELEKPLLTITVDGETYELLKSDGFKVSHVSWFIPSDEKYSLAELFIAYSKIKKEEEERETFEPYLLIFEYSKDGKVLKKEVKPLRKEDFIDLGKTVARIEKKTILEESLSTALDLETTVELLEGKGNEIDLKALYEKIKEKIKSYIYFEREEFYDLSILWAIGTYFSDIFNVYPILFILGPSGSGKSRLTVLICNLSRRGYIITNPTDANLPRIIEGYRPTLGLDDFDKIMRKNKEVAYSLLKHVYKRVAVVPRLEKVSKSGRYFLTMFSLFAPLVINATSSFDETQMETRIIQINITKSRQKFPRKDPDVRYWEKERKLLYKLRFLKSIEVFQIFNSIDTGLSGRNDEIWSPILTIAKLVDDDLFLRMRNFARELVENKEASLYQEEKEVIIAIERLFNKIKGNNLGAFVNEIEFTAKDLNDELKKWLVVEEKELNEKDFEKNYNVRKIGRILETLNIRSKRTGRKRSRIINLKELEKLKESFGIWEEATETEDKNGDIGDVSDVTRGHINKEENPNLTPKEVNNVTPNVEKSDNKQTDIYTKETSQTSQTSQAHKGITSEPKKAMDKSVIISELEKSMVIWAKDKTRFCDFEIIGYFKQNRLLESFNDKEKENLITEILNKWLKTGLLIQLPDARYEFNISKLVQGD